MLKMGLQEGLLLLSSDVAYNSHHYHIHIDKLTEPTKPLLGGYDGPQHFRLQFRQKL
jgi:hypothetical protein